MYCTVENELAISKERVKIIEISAAEINAPLYYGIVNLYSKK